MRTLRATVAVLFAAPALLLVSSVLSPAEAGTAGTAAVTDTLLTVQGPAGTATVTCEPAGGTHPYAQSVCAELAAAFGRIELIPPLPQMFCAQVWQPVQVSVTGTWHRIPVAYSRVESNASCARISRGHVFFF